MVLSLEQELFTFWLFFNDKLHITLNFVEHSQGVLSLSMQISYVYDPRSSIEWTLSLALIEEARERGGGERSLFAAALPIPSCPCKSHCERAKFEIGFKRTAVLLEE